MSIPLLLCTMLLVSGAADAPAQVAPPPPTAQPAAPSSTTPPVLTQTTIVHGTPSDLSGRWLVLFDVAVNAVRRTLPFFLEIQAKDGKPEILEHFVSLPPDMSAELDKHNAAQTLWEPTPTELSALAAGWADLPKNERSVLQVTNDVWEPTAFDESQRQDGDVKDALWVIRQTYQFAPGGQRPVTQVNVFAGKARKGNGWTGTGVVAQVAAAPFPVPITLHGGFRMLRLDATAEPRGFLARLLDAFKGCRG